MLVLEEEDNMTGQVWISDTIENYYSSNSGLVEVYY